MHGRSRPRFRREAMLAVALSLPVHALSLSVPLPAIAQHGEYEYVEETDPLVRQKLEAWQDAKLGLLMHWGP